MTSVQKFSDTSGSGSAGGGCGGQQQQQQSQAAAPSPDADAAACMLDLLLPDTVISILKLLADTPESIVAFSLSCSQAQQLCCDDARHLWLDLCRAITDTLPSQLRRVDWSPSAWGLDSHRELYICLLQPYRALLQQRVWHTAKMPAGQLLVVDAMPPVIVGRSLWYKKLQGDPVSHAVFVVRLPSSLFGACLKGKARVFCCACQPADSLPQEERLQMLSARSGNFNGLCHAQHLAPAQLQFLDWQDSSPSAARRDAAAAAATSGGDPDTQHPPCASSSNTAQAAAPGLSLSLCCTAACGNLYAEVMARFRAAQPHATHPVPQPQPPIPAAAAAPPAGPQQQQHHHHSALTNNSSSSSSTGGGGSSRASGSGSSLPLPDADEVRLTPWDLRWMVEEMDIPAEWRSHAMYMPFQPSPWLQPAAQAGLAGSWEADTDGTQTASGQPGSSRSSSQAGSSSVAAAEAAAAAAEGLTGLWRSTYGSHGVELVQLQLLQAPAGYSLYQQHGLLGGHVESFDACPPGVLLQSVLRTPAPAVHRSMLQAQDSYPEVGGAAGAANSSAVQQQQQEGSQPQAQQQLLLVASKVTGDRNVPAGQVTFAVDLSSRSRAGAGQLLQLPPGTHSDVRRIHAPGARELIVKERYSGLAQIADVYFQSPRLIPVELVVFDDPSCLGLLWRQPMDSFSLMHRLFELP